MEKLIKFLSAVSAFTLSATISAFAVPPYEDLKQFENPAFVREYVKELYEEYADKKKSDSHRNLYWSWGIKMSINSLIERLIKENLESAVRLTLYLTAFFNMEKTMAKGYNPKNYDKKCCIVWAPDINFRNSPLTAYLFANGECLECLRIE